MGSQPLSSFILRLAALCLAGLTAGCGVFGDDWLDNAVEAASGPKAMWYRVQFEADYGTQRVKVDQMVTCTTVLISGGFLGQSPNSAVTEAYPKTAGVDLADGSRVVVRVPDMCRRNRAFVTRNGDSRMTRGWEEVGSFDVMPLVIWSERSRDPERMESYISRDYYRHPEARFKNAKGTLTLWEVGRIPENVREILSAPPFEPFSPNPWVDPKKLGKATIEEQLRGNDRDGRYHGKGPRYAAYTITEIDSVEEWWAKYLDYAPRTEFLLADERNKPEPDPDYETDEVSVLWHVSKLSSRRVGGPDFIYPDCPNQYIRDLMIGVPRMSDLPFNSQDGGAIISGITISENGPYLPDYKNGDYRLKAMQWRACAKRAAQTRTFDIIDGHLDASKAIPGVLVYRKWGDNLHEGGNVYRVPALADQGVQVGRGPSKFNLRLDGTSVQTPNYTADLGIAIQLKPQKRWYFLAERTILFEGLRESIKF